MDGYPTPGQVHEGFQDELDEASRALGALVTDFKIRSEESGLNAAKVDHMVALLRDHDEYSRPMLAHLVVAALDRLSRPGSN
jgi:hypothetical protein